MSLSGNVFKHTHVNCVLISIDIFLVPQRFLQPNFELRTSFIYNDLFIDFLGHITEELVGVPWERIVQTDIFDKVRVIPSNIILF